MKEEIIHASHHVMVEKYIQLQYATLSPIQYTSVDHRITETRHTYVRMQLYHRIAKTIHVTAPYHVGEQYMLVHIRMVEQYTLQFMHIHFIEEDSTEIQPNLLSEYFGRHTKPILLIRGTHY